MIGQILNLAFRLCLITVVAGFGLGLVYSATKDRIAQAEASKTVKGLQAVLPGYEVDPEAIHQADGVQYWVGRKEDGTTGYAFIGEKTGYSSDLQTMVGINKEGEILGISVIYQQETPGLGARVQEVPTTRNLWQWLTGQTGPEGPPPRPWFAEQFEGLQSDEPIGITKGKEWQNMSPEERKALEERNQVSSLAGATISTRAVTESIEEAAQKVLSEVGKTQ
jgi:Na+-translocating ferredoxin:NAD+ oxidoreductase subunit G